MSAEGCSATEDTGVSMRPRLQFVPVLALTALVAFASADAQPTAPPKPAEVTALQAQQEGVGVRLRWKTARERANAGFSVERVREDGRTEEVGFVVGGGSTSRTQEYEKLVDELAPGTHRFRLAIYDFDGKRTEGPEVEVAIGVPVTASVKPGKGTLRAQGRRSSN